MQSPLQKDLKAGGSESGFVLVVALIIILPDITAKGVTGFFQGLRARVRHSPHKGCSDSPRGVYPVSLYAVPSFTLIHPFKIPLCSPKARVPLCKSRHYKLLWGYCGFLWLWGTYKKGFRWWGFHYMLWEFTLYLVVWIVF